MSAGLAALQQWADRLFCQCLGDVTVHLYGLGNEEIGGGGYASQPMNIAEPQQFVFTGQTPKIYGYYLQAGGQKIYSEAFPQPWQSLNAGDAVTLSITVDVKTKQKELELQKKQHTSEIQFASQKGQMDVEKSKMDAEMELMKKGNGAHAARDEAQRP